jgi:hypothetical protein
MNHWTARPSQPKDDITTKDHALQGALRRTRARAMAAFPRRTAVLALAVAAAACGWKTDYPSQSSPLATTVEMQTQDGDSLGSKTLAVTSSTATLTLADVANRAGLSSKYIAIRSSPSGGRVGQRVAVTTTGTVTFPVVSDGTPLRAIFMSTADLPESVMDCFAGASSRPRYSNALSVARAMPGTPGPGGITLLDGDESILLNAIDDINGALVDRRGVVLGRLSWVGADPMSDYRAGFGIMSTATDEWGDPYSDWGYILINPMDPRGTQSTTALGSFLDAFSRNTSQPCSATGTYLADPARDYRISTQGVSLVRFIASIQSVGYY